MLIAVAMFCVVCSQSDAVGIVSIRATIGGPATEFTTVTPTLNAVVLVTGLLPNTRYYYSIEQDLPRVVLLTGTCSTCRSVILARTSIQPQVS